MGLLYLAGLAHDEGNVEEAEAVLAEAERLAVALQNRLAVVEVLELHGRGAVARGMLRRAARVFGTAAAIRDAIGAPVPPHRRGEFDRTQQIVRRQLGAAGLDAATDEGVASGRRALEEGELQSLLATTDPID